MAQYMIEMSHPRDEYLRHLELMADVPDLLARTLWGFMDGSHVGWLIVEAASEEDARRMLPLPLQSEACIAEVFRRTPEEISILHRQLAAA